MHLLDRLYDLEEGQGRITIGGVDIRDIKREDLRRQCDSYLARTQEILASVEGRKSA